MSESNNDLASSTLVVIPTYNEAKNIGRAIGTLAESLPDISVLVVDDGSSDGTADVARSMDGKGARVQVLVREAKLGLGSAYRDGFNWGLKQGFEVLVQMDADLSHNPADVPRLLDELAKQKADLSIGSRYVAGGAMPGWALHRVLLSKLGNAYSQVMLGIKVNDMTAGFRAYKSDLIRRIDMNGVRADGYGFQIEMTYRAHRCGGKIVEVPITFVDRTEGESKMSSSIIFEALSLVTKWGIRDRVNSLKNKSSSIDLCDKPSSEVSKREKQYSGK